MVNIVAVHIDNISLTQRPLPFRLSRCGTTLDINILFLLLLLFLAFSIMFFAIVSGSWLDFTLFLRIFLRYFLILQSGSRLSRVLMFVFISSVNQFTQICLIFEGKFGDDL